MNPGLVVKLRPAGPWRIGPDSGARNRVDAVYHSDSLYSAVASAMARLGTLEEWLNATARAAEPAVCFGSCFPFLDELGYVVPPRTIWPPSGPGLSARVRWKSARFVPLEMVRALLAGERVDENQWTVDGPSECLVPAGRPGPFRTAIRWNAAVDRLNGASERHSVACTEFRPGCGLWTVVSFADDAARERWQEPVKAAFRLLADTGFGGERSRGWGRAEQPEFIEGELPGMILPVAVALPEEVEAEPAPVEEAVPEVEPVEAEPVDAGTPAEEAPSQEPEAPAEEEVASVDAAETEIAEPAAPEAEAPAEPEITSGDASVKATPEIEPFSEAADPVEGEESLAKAPAPEAEPPAEEAPTEVAEAPVETAEAPAAETAEAPAPEAEVVAGPEIEAAAAPVEIEFPVGAEAPVEEPPAPIPAPEPEPAPIAPGFENAQAHWLLSLFSPAADDAVDWKRGDYAVIPRGGRIDSPVRSGEIKQQVHMLVEGSVVFTAAPPKGAAPDVAPAGFPHPVYRSGFALAIPLPEGR